MSAKMNKRVSIVVPVYHNASSLDDLLARFQTVAEQNSEEFEFLFVDDGSKDDSFAVLERLARRDSRVRAIKLTRNFGSNAASSAGVAQATGDCVIAISADLQDPPELIHRLLAKWREGFRVVLAARAQRRDPWLTQVTSNLFWRMFQRFAIPTMPEHGCDFCLIDRAVLNALKATHEPSAGIGMVLWTGFEPAVIFYERREREERYGRSMWTLSKRLTYLIDSFVSFSHVPIRAASMLGIALGSVGVLYALVLVVRRLFSEDSLGVPGWSSLMVVTLVVSGAQLLMIGILGEYMVRTLEATRQRPPFIIDKIVEAPIEAPSAEKAAAYTATPAESHG